MLRLVALILALAACASLALVGVPAGSAARGTPTPTPTPPVATATRGTLSPSPTASATPGAPPAGVVGLTPMPAAAALDGDLDSPELRAVWVDAFHDGFKTPSQVDHLVAWARQANLNAIFVQVRRRGDAYYLKSFEPRTEDPDLAAGFDALQYLIDAAHRGPRRLQVHAWLATLPIWNRHLVPPVSPIHVFNQHGLTDDPSASWLMQRDDGETWAGTEEGGIYYLDPGNPDAARYTTDAYLNVVRQYDVDGIHLDQVRYFEGDPLRWGYNPTSVARFDQQFGRDPASQPAPDDPDWVAWRRDQVTALVRRIYLEAKAIKPNIAVTAAVVAWGAGPRSPDDWQRQAPFAAVLQDWRSWLQTGIVDYVLPMDYYRENSQQAAWFDTWTAWQAANIGSRGVVLGLGAYLNPVEGVLAQLARARALNPLGVALYSYAVPAHDLENASQDERDAVAAQLRTVFTRPAPAPPLAWLSHPSMGGILVDAPGRDGLTVVVQAQGQAAPPRTWRTDGTGVAGAFDLPPGVYTLSVQDPSLGPAPASVQVVAGAVSVVRYGRDR